jgi:hypothetical protein
MDSTNICSGKPDVKQKDRGGEPEKTQEMVSHRTFQAKAVSIPGDFTEPQSSPVSS